MSFWTTVNSKSNYAIGDYDLNSQLQHIGLTTDGELSYRFDWGGYGDSSKIHVRAQSLLGSPVSITQENDTTRTYYRDNNSIFSIYEELEVKQTTRPTQARPRSISVYLFTQNPDLFKELVDISKDVLKQVTAPNTVMALTSGPHGIQLTSIGVLTNDFIAENYSKPVLKQYDHICNCLASTTPCGRLILLQGPPGTGKSYMIRSIVANINSTFVVVSSKMLGELSGPGVLPTIINQVDKSNKSITFILEDADEALTTRDGHNMTKLSDVLNLGDGLLGELMDIRIIATTNAKTVELDPAIVRSGRMCTHLKLNPLTPLHAAQVYKRLVKEPSFDIKKEMPLADVYRLAREDGWVPETAPNKKTGMYL